MVFLIQVGKKTKKQAFMKFHEKAISVSEDTLYSDIESHFAKMYDGFEVNIVRVYEVDISDEIEKTPVKEDYDDGVGKTSHIGDFVVQLTDGEKEMLKEHIDLESKLRSVENNLRLSVEARYKELSYTNIGYYDQIDIRIEDNHVVCKKLPVRGEIFLEAVKKGEEVPCATPPVVEQETQTTPNTPVPDFDPALDELLNQQAEEANQTEGTYDSSNNGTYAVDDIPF